MAEETQHSTRTFLPMIKVSGKNDSSGIGQKDLFWGGGEHIMVILFFKNDDIKIVRTRVC